MVRFLTCCILQLALQRVVLLSFDADSRRISFRHYAISTAPSGVTRGVKALVGGRALPNMSELQDVTELLTRSGYGSVCAPSTPSPGPYIWPFLTEGGPQCCCWMGLSHGSYQRIDH